jgi:hypothetical protein
MAQDGHSALSVSQASKGRTKGFRLGVNPLIDAQQGCRRTKGNIMA